jgi:hypothetical protein
VIPEFVVKQGDTLLRNRPPAVQTPKAHEGTARREARLEAFVFYRPSPPRGKTTNAFGKLRALEVRLVREVKVLNLFSVATRTPYAPSNLAAM